MANTSATKLLEAANNTTQANWTTTANPWADSPYRWLRELTSRRKGAAAEELISHLLTGAGLHVERTGDSDADRIVNGVRCEIKCSTFWDDGGFTFSQLRDQRYDAVILLAVAPHAVALFTVPKKIAWNNATAQHGGKTATETRWIRTGDLTIDDQIPDWLTPYGGNIATDWHRALGWLHSAG